MKNHLIKTLLALALGSGILLLSPAWISAGPTTEIHLSDARVQTVIAAQNKMTATWMQQTEVIGTAVGLGSDGEPVLVVYVDRDAPSAQQVIGRLPATVDAVKVQIEVTDKFRPNPNGEVISTEIADSRPVAQGHMTFQSPPIQLGTSGGWAKDNANGFCCGGTLGALVSINGTQYILSNYHVFESDIVTGGNGTTAQTGDSIIQPGLIDVNCSSSSAQSVATLVKKSSLPNNNVDCSIAQVRSGMVRTDGSILEIGTLSSSTVAASINQAVKKSGRTTGLTHSSVTGINGTISVTYDNECAGGTAFTKTFTNQIIVSNSNNSFLNSGDSGSLLVEDVGTNPRAVGLLYAGSSTNAVANPINDVLNFLGATMVGGGGGGGNGANLTPYQPSGWSDKIVVSTVTGTHTDSNPLNSTNTLYIDFAVLNNGTTAINTTFYTQLFVDGVLRTTFSTAPPLNANYYTSVNDYSIGMLSNGTHTIKIVTDSSGVIAESNENDNTYTKTITVGSVSNQPNLTPYQPSGWSDKIVVSNVTGTNTDSNPLRPTDTLYVDFAVLNNGTGAVNSTFYTQLFVDGALRTTFSTSPPLNANYYTSAIDYSIGTLSAGTHSIKIVTDSSGVVSESNENDNAYTKTITVGSTTGQPNLTPYQPSGWSDKIVVSNVTGTNTDSNPLRPTDTLYVDFAVLNNGSTAVNSTFYTQLFVDGALRTTFSTSPPLNANYYTSAIDYSIGTLGVGTHTIKIVTDSSGVVSESNESDNAYTKTITISSTSTQPNLTPYQPSGWSDKIVVSNVTGTHTDSSPLHSYNTLYVDFAVLNNGATSINVTFYTQLYVDGALRTTFSTSPPLNANYYSYAQDYSIGTLSAGTHTIRIVSDSNNVVAESNEGDNAYTKTISVSP